MAPTPTVLISKAKKETVDEAVNQVKEHLRIKKEIRATQRMIRDILEKDEEYGKRADEARAAARDVKRLRKKVANIVPTIGSLEEKIEGLKDELDGNQLPLFSALEKYRNETGQSRLFDEDKNKYTFHRKFKVSKE